MGPIHDYEAEDYITSPARLTASPMKLFDKARAREIVARKIFGVAWRQWIAIINESLSMVNRRAPGHRPEPALRARPGSRLRRPDHNRPEQFKHKRLAGASRGRRIRRERFRQWRSLTDPRRPCQHRDRALRRSQSGPHPRLR